MLSHFSDPRTGNTLLLLRVVQAFPCFLTYNWWQTWVNLSALSAVSEPPDFSPAFLSGNHGLAFRLLCVLPDVLIFISSSAKSCFSDSRSLYVCKPSFPCIPWMYPFGPEHFLLDWCWTLRGMPKELSGDRHLWTSGILRERGRMQNTGMSRSEPDWGVSWLSGWWEGLTQDTVLGCWEGLENPLLSPSSCELGSVAALETAWGDHCPIPLMGFQDIKQSFQLWKLGWTLFPPVILGWKEWWGLRVCWWCCGRQLSFLTPSPTFISLTIVPR